MEIYELIPYEDDVPQELDEDEETTPISWQVVVLLPIIVSIIVSVVMVNTSVFATHPAEVIIVPAPIPPSGPLYTNDTWHTNATAINMYSGNLSSIGWTWTNTTYAYNYSTNVTNWYVLNMSSAY